MNDRTLCREYGRSPGSGRKGRNLAPTRGMYMMQIPGMEGSATAARELASAVAVLSAMITPAVLISACGSLAISTGNRLGRTIDRTRWLSEKLETLAHEDGGGREPEGHALLLDQLGRATRRSRLLQRAMTRIYLAISVFVATSVAIGIVAVTGSTYAWIPITFGLGGAALLFHATVLLIAESRIAVRAISNEMDFAWRTGRANVPANVRERQARHQGWLSRRRDRRRDDRDSSD